MTDIDKHIHCIVWNRPITKISPYTKPAHYRVKLHANMFLLHTTYLQ